MHPRFTAADILYIALGGTAGSLLRWWIGLGYEGAFPAPTIFINVLGAAALAVLYASQHRLHLQGRYLYMVGFCGSFTTVSLFTQETILLLERGHWKAALLNLALPVGAALLLAGVIIGPVERAVERRRE
ncbi:MAG: fluoride efflux transporter FluC [Oceanipulchritudo sp.]|jgi:CrcB protein